jgi:gluconate kinase
MKTLRCVNLVLAGAMAGVMLAGCGSLKKVPQDECQKLAMKATDTWRASGTGNSTKERLALNSAGLDARTNLARQLTLQIRARIRNFDQQHEEAGNVDAVGKTTELQQEDVNQSLSNVRTICSNTYQEKNGSYKVYVCVEMDEQGLAAIHKKLTQAKKLSIDYDEHNFIKDMKTDDEKEWGKERTKERDAYYRETGRSYPVPEP